MNSEVGGIEELRGVLAANGHRFTRQRARVFEVLRGTEAHPTAEEVYNKVKRDLPSVSLATVYKSLDALVNCGLAQKLTYGDNSARYDGAAHDHAHMRDLQTGRVYDVPTELSESLVRLDPALADAIRQRTGFKVAAVRVELLGGM